MPAHELRDIVAELRARDVRYGAARAMLAQRLSHALLTKMEAAGDSPDDRVQDAVARSPPVRKAVDALWPAVDPVRVVHVAAVGRRDAGPAADGILDADEQALLLWAKAPRGPRTAPWSLADAVLVDEVADLVDREPSLGHVVLDEAQDLSPMQLRAVGRRCSTASATVLGDIAQGTTPWATTDWASHLAHLGKPAAHIEVLGRGYRVPAAVIEFAGRLLPHIAPGVAAPESVRENDGPARHRPSRRPRLPGRGRRGAPGARRAGIGRGHGRRRRRRPVQRRVRRAAGPHVLGSDDGTATRVTLVPATLAKGLEFDHVVVVEPAAIVEGEPSAVQGLRRLYVVLTRAVSGPRRRARPAAAGRAGA